ncbi:glutathione synthetase [Batrachochytrium salamandrivorans]|nr:glutathione synthetase [Batrachochytrium salamandrivorans]
MRAHDVSGPLTVHIPFSLFPSPYPRDCFDLASRLQPLYNALVDSIARDAQFIEEVMDSIANVDNFTYRLFKVYKEASGHPSSQKIWMGLHRSDYLLHQPSIDDTGLLQQVELNTVSSAFPSLSSLTTSLHRYLASRTSFFNPPSRNMSDIHSCLASNHSLTNIVDALGKAWDLYGVKSAAVLMVVQPDEHNIFDQRLIEYGMYEKFGIAVVRQTLGETVQKGKLSDEDKRLFIDSTEIAVVYFRAGYGPGDYPSEKEWSARQLIEESMSIKCPPVVYQLVGTKKMQQFISNPGVLERFVPNAEHAALIRSSFTGLYPLDESPEGIEAYERALKDPTNYVMKPQREGGGNNIYGEQIRDHLLKMSLAERKAYILMDVIRPPLFKNTLVRNGISVTTDVVSELGVYGAYLSDGSTVHMNTIVGHLLRTKMSDSDEGGVAAGFAVLDSPFLQ